MAGRRNANSEHSTPACSLRAPRDDSAPITARRRPRAQPLHPRPQPSDRRSTHRRRAAGFAGIGLYAGQFIRLRENGFAIAELRDLLDAADVCLAEIEVLAGWGSATPADAYWAFEATVWELVDAFESRYVQAIGPTRERPPTPQSFRRRVRPGRRTRRRGGLEFLPFTNSSTPPTRSRSSSRPTARTAVCVSTSGTTPAARTTSA